MTDGVEIDGAAERSSTPFVDVLLGFVRIEDGGEYTFVDRAEEAIVKILDAIFSCPDPEKHLDGLIRLSCALESELRSPAAAAFMRAVLCADHRFLAAIGCGESWEGFRTNPEMAQWSGGQDIKQAPMFGATAPTGTLKAGALVDVIPPHIRRRARAG